MNIIQRIRFPQSIENIGMYLRLEGPCSIDTTAENACIEMRRGAGIQTGTYLNSFYENYYARYTHLKEMYYLLRLEGDFEICMYRERLNAAPELLSRVTLHRCAIENLSRVSLPELQAETGGRIHLKMICLSEKGMMKEGYLATDQDPHEKVSLAVISTTYQREMRIKKTAEDFLRDSMLEDKDCRFYIVDNAKSLSANEFRSPRVCLLPNKNLGGAGGFARGLSEAESHGRTHFLLMDDDAEIETECVYRVITFFEYAKDDFALHGGGISDEDRTFMYEFGATMDGIRKSSPRHIFFVHGFHRSASLNLPEALNLLLNENEVEYGAFWFFSFSIRILRRCGLPLPLFVYGDDAEFGLRVTQQFGFKILALPGLCVWHHPWGLGHILQSYISNYACRNFMIIYSIHEIFSNVRIILGLARSFLGRLFSYNYSEAAMIVRALSDWLRGPQYFLENDSQVIHENLLKVIRHYHTEEKINPEITLGQRNQFHLKAKINIGVNWLRCLTLNGHWLPDFLLRKKTPVLLEWQSSRSFRNKEIFVFKGRGLVFRYKMHRRLANQLFWEWCRTVFIFLIKGRRVRRAWKQHQRTLSSREYWQKMFSDEIPAKIENAETLP